MPLINLYFMGIGNLTPLLDILFQPPPILTVTSLGPVLMIQLQYFQSLKWVLCKDFPKQVYLQSACLSPHPTPPIQASS